jgi:predicted regulator of Ras-like GTPase activity (Roadblock/LC7/MglB family)
VNRRYEPLLENLTRTRGVRGALVVAAEDGLVVAESLMAGLKGTTLAAMAATLAARAAELAARAGLSRPRFLHLQAEAGALLVAPASADVIVVAVAGRDVPLGPLRLELLRVAEQLA